MAIHNPILRGFHPDPSIIRVRNDYYIATSTFEWFPGVRIHHSTDLQNWVYVCSPLDRISLLDMKGVPDSCGVWAPCLSHDGELYYLVYSQVRSFDGVWKDTPNYLTTARNITGPWSDPISLGSHGFDASLFHDEDGRKWYLSMEVDHRKGKFFGGIILQEYDLKAEKLTGPVYRIFEGTELGKTEGPHLYQKDGYYYLITAEGGTEYGHAVSLARSKEITGPYEVQPENPILTAKDHPNHPIQKTGHADLVQTESGEWYIVFLAGRPLAPLGKCPLGRETCIEKLSWPEGEWPRLEAGGKLARVSIPESQMVAPYCIREVVDFESDILPDTYQSLRVPQDKSWVAHLPKSGSLRLFGRESLTSLFEQSLLARRVQSQHFTYEISVDFHPKSFQQMAGLVAYYNTGHYLYFYVMGDESGTSRWLQLIMCDNFQMSEAISPIELPDEGKISLGLRWMSAEITFSYSVGEGETNDLPGTYDGSILSDDHVRDGSERYRPAFTGAFVGIACQDLSGTRASADFATLAYEEMS
ncbi:MAG: glycoside hydrolase family 43 protein [Bacteroidota bacterium]